MFKQVIDYEFKWTLKEWEIINLRRQKVIQIEN